MIVNIDEWLYELSMRHRIRYVFSCKTTSGTLASYLISCKTLSRTVASIFDYM
ncbi:hypothetical protein F383_06483 [Gossypium arboreum]|uniref:Uncharacterized protein n=1 Tax=Gossypium arboreum TaxID=29729 RepID=A0A0B0NKF1_GOSAR|nr:hypothetical protein F383_06483 [Gossypium arboreum]